MLADDDAVHGAAAPYTRAFLAVYDWWVIGLSNRYAWRCGAEVMLQSYQQHLGKRHLDVGPGSGWYLANTPGRGVITLMDLNPAPLAYASRRLETAGCDTQTVIGSVLDPVPETAGSQFDSIGLNFVLHCLPGGFAGKGVAFRHLARVLADDGVLFGSTILGRRPRAMFGRVLSWVYSRLGAFNNAADDRKGLREALDAAFEKVAITEVGEVTLFTASRPRRQDRRTGESTA